jgi:cell division protein FtsN
VAARRGKSQARRNHGNSGGLPGWAWMVLGIVLTIGVILLAPKWLKTDGDGLWRPQPNPDAQPAQVSSSEDELVVPDVDTGATRPEPAAATAQQDDNDSDPEYDFYTLLPGKEVPLSDAELAATARAEAQRSAAQQKAQPAETITDAAPPLPQSIDRELVAAPKPVATTPAAAIAGAEPADDARYLLQAGAFEASGQAEELKARIALLGLGARVESAAIKGTTVYRVRMGPYGTAGDLAEAKRKLASGGLPAMAIKVQ